MSDLTLQLAVPIIVTAGMTEAEFQQEVRNMQLRQLATQEFCDGILDAGEWLDILDECGVEVASAVRDWGQGVSYLG